MSSADTVIDLPDEAATERLARRFSHALCCGDVIALYGDLGAGKTTFARALIRALGVEDEVPSPTFTLVQTYPVEGQPFDTVCHFDLYRIESPEETFELGLDDAMDSGIALIEWPERMGTFLPTDHLAIRLEFGNSGRTARIAGGAAWQARLETIEQMGAPA